MDVRRIKRPTWNVAPDRAQGEVFTVGHSNGSLEDFVSLLKDHEVEVLIDTRSQPYSRYSPQFNHTVLSHVLDEKGIRYCYLGDRLGGRPPGKEFYGPKQEVLYKRVAEHPFYQEGIEELLHEVLRHTVCILCSEEDPTKCHRRLLVGKTLVSLGFEVKHIRRSGVVETEEEVDARERRENPLLNQLTFSFDDH